uniref:Amine oxidase domain-containing protein n=1 Tax=Strigamia maritima TaxID=126957 RepID=T1IPE7_STRMM
MSRVLLVGSGLTSAVTAYTIRPMYKNKHKIIVYERARGMGGRMSTTRNPNRPECTADLGMQYITTSPRYTEIHKTFYEDLQKEGLLKLVPIPNLLRGYKTRKPGLKYYTAPKGVGAVVKYFFNKSDTDVKFEKDVRALDLVEPEKQWRVTLGNGEVEHFDTVLITIPIPEILQLNGTISDIIQESKDIHQNLKEVRYSSRFALGLFFDYPIPLEVDYSGGYFKDRTIRYISIENRKRNLGENAPTAIVIHTSKTFGSKYVNEDINAVQKMIMERIPEFLPNLPIPSYVKIQKWQFSQVVKPYKETPGYVVLKDKPLLILAGDGFAQSTFDGCITSGLRLADRSRSIFTRVFKPDPRP